MTRRRYVWRVTATFEDGRTETRALPVRGRRPAPRRRPPPRRPAVQPANPPAATPRAEAVVIERSAPVDGWQVIAS